MVIPANRQRRRVDKDDQVYVDDIGKWKAVAREIDNSHRIGPIHPAFAAPPSPTQLCRGLKLPGAVLE